MELTVKEHLLQLKDEEYKAFHSRLLPGVNNIIGIRIPLLRSFAKDIAKGNWQEYLEGAQDEYNEEVMLQGLVIGYVKADVNEILKRTSQYVPKLTNWALCDSFCSGLKITKKHKSEMWNFIQPYFKSDKEYEMRFAIVMLLDFFIEDEYIDKILLLLDEVNHDGYYVKMAVAWALSVCFVKYPDKTMLYFKRHNLDAFTYNKTLQKITESFRVDKETKAIIRSMRI